MTSEGRRHVARIYQARKPARAHHPWNDAESDFIMKLSMARKYGEIHSWLEQSKALYVVSPGSLRCGNLDLFDVEGNVVAARRTLYCLHV